MRGFIVRQPWADLILSGKKTWEIRSSNTKIRGRVGIVSQGEWIGTVEIVGSSSLSNSEFDQNRSKHCVPEGAPSLYESPCAWMLANPVKFEKPRKYAHKIGCVIWVNLNDSSIDNEE